LILEFEESIAVRLSYLGPSGQPAVIIQQLVPTQDIFDNSLILLNLSAATAVGQCDFLATETKKLATG
jgi:hypothetical protein